MGTYDELKKIVFEQAEKQAAGPTKLALPDLAKDSTVRVELPVLDSYDKDTEKTTCAGALHIVLPEGAVKAVGGGQDLSARVKYTTQPAADGSGTVYELLGGDDLIGGLAGADLSDWAARFEPHSSAPAASTAGPDVRTEVPQRRAQSPRSPPPSVGSDQHVCAHGDPQDADTIEACDRIEFAKERAGR
jgi:hypothetical protein